jgi:hypothetical protein
MCVIVAKYFDGIGWAGAKNRDRTYTPELDFIESKAGNVDRMMMYDLVTGYKEGINSRGVSILNTSLDVGNIWSHDSAIADLNMDGFKDIVLTDYGPGTTVAMNNTVNNIDGTVNNINTTVNTINTNIECLTS